MGHRAQAQTSAGRARQRMQGPIRSLSAAGAGVAPARLVLRQAATADGQSVRSLGRAAVGIRQDLGRSLEGAGTHVAVEGVSVAVVKVRWIDGDVGWRHVVPSDESHYRRLAVPAVVAGAVMVVDSPRS